MWSAEKFSLELVRQLEARIVPELEVLRAVKRIAAIRTLRIEGVEQLDEPVLRGDVAAADRKALDTVEVAVGEIARAVAAEERTVLEVLVVHECVPRSGDVRVRASDVEA